MQVMPPVEGGMGGAEPDENKSEIHGGNQNDDEKQP